MQEVPKLFVFDSAKGQLLLHAGNMSMAMSKNDNTKKERETLDEASTHTKIFKAKPASQRHH